MSDHGVLFLRAIAPGSTNHEVHDLATKPGRQDVNTRCPALA